VLDTLKVGPVDEMDSDTVFRISARHADMEVLRVKGNLSLIKKLNLPAILEFPHPDGSGSGFLAWWGLPMMRSRCLTVTRSFRRACIAGGTVEWGGPYLLEKLL
jgi:hypothetical protein